MPAEVRNGIELPRSGPVTMLPKWRVHLELPRGHRAARATGPLFDTRTAPQSGSGRWTNPWNQHVPPFGEPAIEFAQQGPASVLPHLEAAYARPRRDAAHDRSTRLGRLTVGRPTGARAVIRSGRHYHRGNPASSPADPPSLPIALDRRPPPRYACGTMSNRLILRARLRAG